MTTTAENSTGTTKVVGRPFPKGVTGNPGGRPKGLASIIRDRTFDGQELVDFYTSVFRGEKIDGVKPALKHRMEAGTWLSDRGFGKPVQSVQMAAQVQSAQQSTVWDALNDMTPAEVLATFRGKPLPGDIIEGDAKPTAEREA
ncbi:MAG: hypothetical protein FI707_12150 [SAR202 cluster bacterium]|jgi:hypothetical protein|nr:hypothetical protein [SAR202 cluster bacterium]MDP6663087.1 hypothetical protein [SAR202 cluster bacterium]MDP6798777.1 hypothetical protein [SAR202 cluster bacterium]MQG56952.1 hypothetical protein [SAR202 cluster bacterium]MQG69528.1 hypothetical protein [SAR202 cluster bacterium]|tara:strand:+ start:8059 stop:8487 length:429 start_codon:yes stop_codon:yes gene_type:complete